MSSHQFSGYSTRIPIDKGKKWLSSCHLGLNKSSSNLPYLTNHPAFVSPTFITWHEQLHPIRTSSSIEKERDIRRHFVVSIFCLFWVRFSRLQCTQKVFAASQIRLIKKLNRYLKVLSDRGRDGTGRTSSSPTFSILQHLHRPCIQLNMNFGRWWVSKQIRDSCPGQLCELDFHRAPMRCLSAAHMGGELGFYPSSCQSRASCLTRGRTSRPIIIQTCPMMSV